MRPPPVRVPLTQNIIVDAPTVVSKTDSSMVAPVSTWRLPYCSSHFGMFCGNFSVPSDTVIVPTL